MVGVGSLPSDELTASGTGSSWVLQWAGSPEGQRRGRSVRWASRAPLLFSRSVVSDSLRPYGLPHYEHPGRSFSRVPAKVKSESEVAQSCPTLCDPVGCSLPGSSVRCHFLLQGIFLTQGSWHCLSLGLEWKLTFSCPVATAESSNFAGILNAALSQHHLLGFEIAPLEFHLISTSFVSSDAS